MILVALKTPLNLEGSVLHQTTVLVRNLEGGLFLLRVDFGLGPSFELFPASFSAEVINRSSSLLQTSFSPVLRFLDILDLDDFSEPPSIVPIVPIRSSRFATMSLKFKRVRGAAVPTGVAVEVFLSVSD